MVVSLSFSNSIISSYFCYMRALYILSSDEKSTCCFNIEKNISKYWQSSSSSKTSNQAMVESNEVIQLHNILLLILYFEISLFKSIILTNTTYPNHTLTKQFVITPLIPYHQERKIDQEKHTTQHKSRCSAFGKSSNNNNKASSSREKPRRQAPPTTRW